MPYSNRVLTKQQKQKLFDEYSKKMHYYEQKRKNCAQKVARMQLIMMETDVSLSWIVF